MEQAPPPGFDKLTTQAVQQKVSLEKQIKLEERAQESIALKKEKEKIDPKPIKQPKNMSIKGMKDTMELQKQITQELSKDNRALMKRKEDARRRVIKFKTNETLGPFLKNIKEPLVSASHEEWEACLSQIKSELGSRNALRSFWEYVTMLCGSIEGAVIMYPAFFQGINLSYPISITALVSSDKVQQRLNNEANELSILYDNWLSSSAEFRFLRGFADIIKEVALANKAARAASTVKPPSSLARKMEEMEEGN